MAIKFQYNKTSLTNLGKQLKVRQRALPTLKNKESALRLSVIQAKKDSERLAAELEAAINGGSAGRNCTYSGRMCCLTPGENSELELSDMFGRVNVKRLPRKNMMSVLRRKKGYLQTVGLICDSPDRALLSDALIRCGVNRVTSAGNMSAAFAGESHDGEYSLRRYVRIANAELTEDS